MNYITDLIPKHTMKRPYKLLEKVYFVVAHDVGVSGSTARDNRDYFHRTANESYSCAHIFVDDKEAIMLIPAFEEAEVTYHVGSNSSDIDNDLYGIDSNYGAIGVEMCYFEDDFNRTMKSYKNYVDILTDLFIFHKLPLSEISGHFQLSPTNRTDPNNALKHIGKTFDNLVADIRMQYNIRMTENVSDWAVEGYKFVVTNGISDGSRPKENTTREEEWTMMHRLYEKIIKDLKG